MSIPIKIHKKHIAVETRGEMWNHPDNMGGTIASRLVVSATLDVSIKDEGAANLAARRWEVLVNEFLEEIGPESP